MEFIADNSTFYIIMNERPLVGLVKGGEKLVSNSEIFTFDDESEWNSEVDKLKVGGKDVINTMYKIEKINNLDNRIIERRNNNNNIIR